MRLYVAFNAPIRVETAEVYLNGDNHIQNFHLGRYIVGYTFGNHVLRLRSRVAVKLNFRPYIRRYTSPNENFEYSYPLNFTLHPPHSHYLTHQPLALGHSLTTRGVPLLDHTKAVYHF